MSVSVGQMKTRDLFGPSGLSVWARERSREVLTCLARSVGAAAAALPLVAVAAGLAPTIDSGSIQKDLQSGQRGPIEAPYPQISLPTPVQPIAGGTRFSVNRFVLTGVTVFALDEAASVLKPWTDKPLDFAGLRDAALALEGYYQANGFLARVVIPPQDVVNGVVNLTVIEGQLGGVEIVQTDVWPVSKERLNATVQTQVRPGGALDLVALERGVGLINALPGVRASGAIKAGSLPDTSDVVIAIDRGPVFEGVVQTDNTGNARTGTNRLSTNLAWNNPGGYGDRVLGNLMASQGLRFVQVGYSAPVGYGSDRLALNASRLNYTLIGGVPGLASLGSAGVTNLEWTRQLAYSRRGRSNFSAQLTRSVFSDTSGPETTKRQVQAGVISLSSTRYWGTGSSSRAQIGLTLGRVDLSDTPANEDLDQSGLNTKGSYRKVNVSLIHTVPVRSSSSVYISATGQRAQKNLDSSERLALGGVNSVRAYPSSEGSGDQGLLVSAEWREALNSDLQAKAFYDVGRIRKSKSPVPGVLDTPNSYLLRGWGVGLDYQVRSQLKFSMTLARRVGVNPGAQLSESGDYVENDGTHKVNRVWINLTANF